MRRDELIGRTIANRFRITSVLGEGGMATVFIAEQDAEPREVALKVLRAELTSDKTFAKRFEREATAAARVQHPNSVKILDAGVEGQLSYIAMELLRGDDLYTLLERYGVLAPRDAATILAEVCDALAVAHGLGIVHRDLKPENIMVVRDPASGDPGGALDVPVPPGSRVKVLDFGIAKLLEKPAGPPGPRGNDVDPPSQMTAVTRVGTLIGTPAYMSPEQCAMLPIDTRSDIYTCGVLLFQLVTGRLPFEGPTPIHIAMKHIHEEPPALRSLVPEASAALEAVLLKALAKRATERHPTARHLGASLRKILAELPDTPYPSARPGRDIEESTTDALPGGGPPASVVPEPIASAKTIVAEGLDGPPPSVVVRNNVETQSGTALLVRPAAPPEPKRPAPPAVEPEPEELAATLVAGGNATALLENIDPEYLAATRRAGPALEAIDEEDLAATRKAVSPATTTGRQLTMQSARAPVPAARPSSAAAGGGAPMHPGADPARPSVILAPSLSTSPAQLAPPAMRNVPAPAPTFGLPAAGSADDTASRPAILARPLWLGVGIGLAVSAVLFAVVYVLLIAK